MSATAKGVAVEWTLGVADTGNEQIAVLFRVVGGELDGNHYTWRGYFTEKAIDRTLDALRYCGWDSDSLAELDNLGANEVSLQLEDEVSQKTGKTYTKVAFVNRPQRLVVNNQMSPQQAAAFAARLRGKTVAHKQQYGAQPAAAPAASRQPAATTQRRQQSEPDPGATDFDDIPF